MLFSTLSGEIAFFLHARFSTTSSRLVVCPGQSGKFTIFSGRANNPTFPLKRYAPVFNFGSYPGSIDECALQKKKKRRREKREFTGSSHQEEDKRKITTDREISLFEVEKKTQSKLEACEFCGSPPSPTTTRRPPRNLQGHTWRAVEGVGPLCLVHLVTDLHIVRIVHYVLYHVLQHCVTREHRIHLRAIVFFLRWRKAVFFFCFLFFKHAFRRDDLFLQKKKNKIKYLTPRFLSNEFFACGTYSVKESVMEFSLISRRFFFSRHFRNARLREDQMAIKRRSFFFKLRHSRVAFNL